MASKPKKRIVKFLSIAPKYFERVEHYKSGERSTIWIKVHFDLLDHFEFCELPDAAKWQFIGLLMFAVKCGNIFPNNPQFLANKIGANGELFLEKLMQNGYIVGAKRLQSECKNEAKRMKNKGEFDSTEQEQEQSKKKNNNKQDEKLLSSGSKFSKAEIRADIIAHGTNGIDSLEAVVNARYIDGELDPRIQARLDEENAKAAAKAERERERERLEAEDAERKRAYAAIVVSDELKAVCDELSSRLDENGEVETSQIINDFLPIFDELQFTKDEFNKAFSESNYIKFAFPLLKPKIQRIKDAVLSRFFNGTAE